MAEKKPKPTPKKPSFTAEERAAMRERARELKAEAAGVAGEKDVLAKIAEMPPSDRKIAKRLHQLVKAAAPDLAPRTWYGMPAYARDGKVVCFFQSSHRFKTRYSTFGFSDRARLVADLLRADRADRGRRGEDHAVGEASREVGRAWHRNGAWHARAAPDATS